MSQSATMQDATPPPHLLREDRDHIARLTLNRPEQRNALSSALIATLIKEIGRVSRDPSVRAVVLAANGPVFCAGHDLKELTEHRKDADKGRSF